MAPRGRPAAAAMPRRGARKRLKFRADDVCSERVTVADYANSDPAVVKSGRVKKAVANAVQQEVKSLCGLEASCVPTEEVLSVSGESCDSSDEMDTKESISGRAASRKKKSKRHKDAEGGGGEEYPIDIWLLLASYIRPEDIVRFSLICKKAWTVTCTAAFWTRLYRRHYSLDAYLPLRLRPESMEKLHCLRACVIRSLFHMYEPFAARLSRNPAIPDSTPSTLKNSRVQLRGLAPDMILQLLQPEGAQRILRDTAELSALHNISYQLLAGSLAPQKKFLAVGMASVQRPRGFYLLATLQSLFSQSTEEELQEMVVVVHLADTDPGWNVRVATTIAQKFARHILLGQLLLIHAPPEFYPTLEGLKRNFNDAEERVKFRSKQNVDYAFLLAFAANLSSYYLMIEDDVWSARSFLTAIRRALASQEGSNWATLEFSKLGYIGKLYRSSDLPRLAHFLLLFYQEMPCDWLLVHFRQLLTQKDVIRFKPSLFQHMGLYSSFQGTVNRLKDEDFQADALDLPDNPPASVLTSMSIFENYEPLKAYSLAQGYFWGKDPAAGSTFSIVFQQPARVSRVRVRTGSMERPGDFLRAGLLELGQHRDRGQDCSSYIPVGSFKKGTLEQQGLERVLPGPVECVRIRVTQDQSEWLIIQSIDIWTTAGT